MDDLISGYEYFKEMHGKKYTKEDTKTKETLSNFRKQWEHFTDKIAKSTGLKKLKIGNWLKADGRTIQEYLWNRYKLPEDTATNLVIYFSASAEPTEGLFVSIGLIDDKLNKFEEENRDKIYQYLENKCKQIDCLGFERKDAGWGERVFKIIDEMNYEKADYDCLMHKLKAVYAKTIENMYNPMKSDSIVETYPSNQILYGPPGTGKTYHTINRALQIIDGSVPDYREDIKARFEVLKDVGQIEFVTFHQSYGYEEFVEGIKAKTTDRGIEYEIEPGIFRKLSDRARKQYEDSGKSQSQIASELSTRKQIEDFLNTALDEEKSFFKTKGGEFKIKDLSEKSIVLYAKDSNYNDNVLELSIDEFYKIVESGIEFKSSRQIAQEIFNIPNQRQKDTYYLSLYKEYTRSSKESETVEKYQTEELKNYILIIDEINRGNISKIFGELITLIEESKRLGNDEAMEATLPYSGDKFGVPKNLYIIGTMNTADRSIALMDTALRRRFEFEEMMPDYGVIREKVGNNGVVDGINIALLLEKINQRIEYLYDRDHTIGHAYFLDVVDKHSLDSAMRNKVIPLLQEYFYDDWEKIQLVLNDGFIFKKEQKPNDLFDKIDDEFIDEDKYTYSIAQEFSTDSYRKIYGKIEEN